MLFISATDTGVGKTHFSVEIMKSLIAEGINAAYYKPIQCGRENGLTDSDVLCAAIPDLQIYNSIYLDYPAAPYLSQMLEHDASCNKKLNHNLPEVDLEKIFKDWQEIKAKHDFVLVEGAGGLAVPIKKNYLISDLIVDLALDLVLVIRPNLGTLNHSLLSIEHARNKKINLVGFIRANYPEAKEPAEVATAAEVLTEFTALPALTPLGIIKKCLQKA